MDSRPITPESPLTSSLDDITNTIDDLTLALNNFSRVPSPEPPTNLTCCCQREDCENFKAWQETKSRLESRLVLSAEIGQALLQRHEAYVRRHEVGWALHCSINEDTSSSGEDGDSRRLSELQREKNALEKRLTQALVNNEVSEVSSKTLHQELQEARNTISRLSASNAKSIGWETRLSVAAKERDDMQQERDFESQRARLAESRFAALKEKTSKLQSEMRRLQDELEQRRLLRMESTESLVQDAKTRIQILQASIGSPSTLSENSELTKVLESLVDDNEGLKRDNAELQALLTESRDDLHALQQEVEEQRANIPINPRSRAGTPLMSQFGRTHHYSGSMPSSVIREQVAPLLNRRNSSLERRGLKPPEPLTPDTLIRDLPPISPGDPESRSPFGHPRHNAPLPPSPYQIEFDSESNTGDSTPEKARSHRPLFLLTRSRAVQTDPQPSGLLSPSPAPTSPSPSNLIPVPSPHDPRSESSSFSESTASNMAILVERVSALLTRMTQADALTLTNRLKRQHLRGADVGHLSRSTVSNIINDIAGLRIQFRHLLEDENLVMMCNRKDLRALFKFFREVFGEMAGMRVTLNDVILDPSIAPKISELALDPSKAENKDGSAGSSGWMAPISKLFGGSSTSTRSDAAVGSSGSGGLDRAVSPAAAALGGLVRSTSHKGNSNARAARFVPKLQPALSASATTVNVEFSAGVGRSVTSSSESSTPTPGPSRQHTGLGGAAPSTAMGAGSSSVMGIFAGAPQPNPDPWVVIPKGPRRVQSAMLNESPFRRPGFGGPMMNVNPNRLSRNVDAVIDEQNTRLVDGDVGESVGNGDGEEQDTVTPLAMQRTLRRRGLSDSSIHSTYLGQAQGGDESMTSDGTTSTLGSASASASTTTTDSVSAWPIPPSRVSVLQALGRRVQFFKGGMAFSDVLSPSSYDERRQGDTSTSMNTNVNPNPSSRPSTSAGTGTKDRAVSKSSLGSFIPDLSLSSWAAGHPEGVVGVDPAFAVGSPPRDESAMMIRSPHRRDRDGMGDGW
ncbi:hypothetical protein GYMLUDRAFT_56777 [Collybiopsis luxurians FD-317 M1]|nr:hypothetical protein GYMLUDRAFT_56777 [Collybiopsis luxurians FD-317 M1]